MIDRGDDRAVSTVIGAVLLLGILVTALALYQVNVVPDENSQIEWEHHQRVHGDLLDLRNAIGESGEQRNVRETTAVRLELGTQYPTRTWTMNPPNPQGELRSVYTDDEVVVDFGDDEDRFTTSFLEYEPGYNEYDGPTTVIEHGLLYERHADGGVVTRDRGTVIQGDDVVIPLVVGDLSESSVGSASVSLTRLIEYQESEEAVDHVRWPTDEVDEWNESYDAVKEYEDEEGYVVVDDPDRVFIAEIGVGNDPETENAFGDNWESSSPPDDSDDEEEDDRESMEPSVSNLQENEDDQTQMFVFELGDDIQPGDEVTINLDEAQEEPGTDSSNQVNYDGDAEVDVTEGEGGADLTVRRGQGEAELTYTAGDGDDAGDQIVINIQEVETSADSAGNYEVIFSNFDGDGGEVETEFEVES